MEEASQDDNHRRGEVAISGGQQEPESGSEDKGKPPASKKRRRGSSASDEASSSLNERWEEMFSRLRIFKAKTGHCNVPNRYPEDPQLGFWVSTQRRQYRVLTSGSSTSSALTLQRAQKLINLGFEWSAKDPRMVPWETRFNQLKEFAEKNGHAQVPIGWEENIPLSNWVSKQRQEYKLLLKGKTSRLTPERIKLLNDIGFVWEAKRGAPRQVITIGNSQSTPPAAAGTSSEQASTHTTASRALRERTHTTPTDPVPTPSAAPQHSRTPERSHSFDRDDPGVTSPQRPYMPPPTWSAPQVMPPPSRYSYPFGPETSFHGQYTGAYSTNNQPHYPAYQAYSPIRAAPPYPAYDSYPPPSYSFPPSPTTSTPWSMSRPGRILTPLYPIEPTSSSNFRPPYGYHQQAGGDHDLRRPPDEENRGHYEQDDAGDRAEQPGRHQSHRDDVAENRHFYPPSGRGPYYY